MKLLVRLLAVIAISSNVCASSVTWSATQAGKTVEVTIVTAKLDRDYCIGAATIVAEVDGREVSWRLTSCPIHKSERPVIEQHQLQTVPSKFTARRMEGEIFYCGIAAEHTFGTRSINCVPDAECVVSSSGVLP